MIVLNKDAVNNLILTLYEKTTITDFVYRFIFRSESTKEERTVELEDISQYSYRYNQFMIDEGSTAELTFHTGEWSYTVEAYNDDGSEVVETGIMQVRETATANTEYSTTTTNTTYTG